MRRRFLTKIAESGVTIRTSLRWLLPRGIRNHMNTNSTENNLKRWLVVVVYATAMAWVESAVVYYLRTMTDRITPYQLHPLPLIGGLGPAELVREAATMVM